MAELSAPGRDIDRKHRNDTISVAPFRPSDVTFARHQRRGVLLPIPPSGGRRGRILASLSPRSPFTAQITPA